MPMRDQHIAHFPTLAAIKTPRLISLVAWMLIASSFGAIAFLSLTPWVQTAAGRGSVTALNPNDGVQDINAFVSGRIAEWSVRDGSSVKAGAPIVRIVDNDPQLLSRLASERAQNQAALNAAETALRTAEIDARRTNALFQEGLASRREFELAQIKVEDFRSKAADAAAALNRIDVSLSRQSAQIVTAPRDGVILKVNAGDTATYISAGDPVATFIPDGGKRAVELFINGRDIALVRPGAGARLEFEGWPAVQFSGWPSIAIGTFRARVLSVDPSASANGLFRILLVEEDGGEPWPDERFIRFGSAVRGWILLETVPVGYELWRQLNDFPPEFSSNAQAAPSSGEER